MSLTAKCAEPFYDNGTCTIFLGDCREILPQLAPQTADLIVADPPYGMNWLSNSRTKKFGPMVGDNGTIDVPAALNLALRILRPRRHIYVFGRFDLSSLPLGSTTELIWDKAQMSRGNLSLPWGVSHERITFGVYVPSQKNREDGDGRLAARLRRNSIIRSQRLNSRQVQRHPTEKPVDLLRQLIESSSMLGETILDPFMGSASTLVAAQMEGRKAIGIEIDEQFCEAAAQRIERIQR